LALGGLVEGGGGQLKGESDGRGKWPEKVPRNFLQRLKRNVKGGHLSGRKRLGDILFRPKKRNGPGKISLAKKRTEIKIQIPLQREGKEAEGT